MNLDRHRRPIRPRILRTTRSLFNIAKEDQLVSNEDCTHNAGVNAFLMLCYLISSAVGDDRVWPLTVPASLRDIPEFDGGPLNEQNTASYDRRPRSSPRSDDSQEKRRGRCACTAVLPPNARQTSILRKEGGRCFATTKVSTLEPIYCDRREFVQVPASFLSRLSTCGVFQASGVLVLTHQEGLPRRLDWH